MALAHPAPPEGWILRRPAWLARLLAQAARTWPRLRSDGHQTLDRRLPSRNEVLGGIVPQALNPPLSHLLAVMATPVPVPPFPPGILATLFSPHGVTSMAAGTEAPAAIGTTDIDECAWSGSRLGGNDL